NVRAVNDGYSAATSALSITRAGYTATGVIFWTLTDFRQSSKMADGGFFYTPYIGATDTGTVRAGIQYDGANSAVNFYTGNVIRGNVQSDGTLHMTGLIQA